MKKLYFLLQDMISMRICTFVIYIIFDNICYDNKILKRHCVHHLRSIRPLVIVAAVQENRKIILNKASIVAHCNF